LQKSIKRLLNNC